VAIPDGHGAGLEPAVLTVEATDAKLDVEMVAAPRGGSPGLLDSPSIVGMELLGPAGPDLSISDRGPGRAEVPLFVKCRPGRSLAR
jgi:hypothetical protein